MCVRHIACQNVFKFGATIQPTDRNTTSTMAEGLKPATRALLHVLSVLHNGDSVGVPEEILTSTFGLVDLPDFPKFGSCLPRCTEGVNQIVSHRLYSQLRFQLYQHPESHPRSCAREDGRESPKQCLQHRSLWYCCLPSGHSRTAPILTIAIAIAIA